MRNILVVISSKLERCKLYFTACTVLCNIECRVHDCVGHVSRHLNDVILQQLKIVRMANLPAALGLSPELILSTRALTHAENPELTVILA